MCGEFNFVFCVCVTTLLKSSQSSSPVSFRVHPHLLPTPFPFPNPSLAVCGVCLAPFPLRVATKRCSIQLQYEEEYTANHRDDADK